MYSTSGKCRKRGDEIQMTRLYIKGIIWANALKIDCIPRRIDLSSIKIGGKNAERHSEKMIFTFGYIKFQMTIRYPSVDIKEQPV